MGNAPTAIPEPYYIAPKVYNNGVSTLPVYTKVREGDDVRFMPVFKRSSPIQIFTYHFDEPSNRVFLVSFEQDDVNSTVSIQIERTAYDPTNSGIFVFPSDVTLNKWIAFERVGEIEGVVRPIPSVWETLQILFDDPETQFAGVFQGQNVAVPTTSKTDTTVRESAARKTPRKRQRSATAKRRKKTPKRKRSRSQSRKRRGKG